MPYHIVWTDNSLNIKSNDSSVLDGDGAVRHGGQIWVVCDDDEGLVHLVAKAEKELVEFLCRLGVEVAGRLVGQHHGGLIDEGTCHGNALLLAARKLGGFMVFSFCKVQVFKQLFSSFCGFFLAHAANVCGNADVLDGGKFGQQVMELEHESNFVVAEGGQLGVI